MIVTTMESATGLSSSTSSVHKGKTSNRSWPQLPPEIIRLIATHFLLETSRSANCPHTWEVHDAWPNRMVFALLRDALQVEKLMSLCPAWSIALETHLYWQQACVTIDPHDVLATHAVIPAPANAGSNNIGPQRLSPYRHFRNMMTNSCVVCRINNPFTNNGLFAARRFITTPALGLISICRDHRRANAFCGVCLCESPPFPVENDSAAHLVAIAENEDEETWPGVEATCRSCREEWLWKRVVTSEIDREAVGGNQWESQDWETRQTVDTFIECAEGTISEVLNVAQEKYWLRKNTKISDMLSQALAASRLASRDDGTGGYESEDELSEDEEDPELMSLTEDAGGVRELAVNDWARHRILDGHWYSPADQYYGNSVGDQGTVVPAIHPCPWTVEDDEHSEPHPLKQTTLTNTPKSYQLCDQVYRAYQKQMKLILLPAMRNLVRKLVIECTADGVDPALKASRMDLESVTNELRDEGVWYNGVDWLERRANRKKAEVMERRRASEDDSSTSSKSDGSHTTSPVLSTTTLQTTPSPPPIEDKEDLVDTSPVQWPIPISPTLDPPQLINSIPYIPTTLNHLPMFSYETISSVWREATAPLYHCRCQICERATLKANGISSLVNQTMEGIPVPLQKPLEVEIKQTATAVLEGEEEEEEDDLTSVTESTTDLVITSKKRPSTDLGSDDDDEGGIRGRGGTPPKRARLKGAYSPTTVEGLSPRLRKRSPEELEDGLDIPGEQQQISKKKRRTSLYAASETTSASGGEDLDPLVILQLSSHPLLE